jgi:chemotaxis protein CheZ
MAALAQAPDRPALMDTLDATAQTAGAHLQAIMRDTETAANAILDAAEAILKADTREQVAAEINKVLEACSFQDITGQRVRKVADALASIETRVARIKGGATERQAVQSEPAFLAGPGLSGPYTDQRAVDVMISSQGEIDALFI